MLKTTFGVAIFAISCTCFAGELVRDATIIEVANTAYGSPDFVVKVAGGTGICTTVFIIFPEAKAKSPTSNKQAIATALLAFSTGKKVRIHNFEDNACDGANFISITH